MLVGILLCIGLPLAAVYAWRGAVILDDPAMVNTIAGSLAALFTGIYFSRRLTIFPGTRLRENVIPCFLITFGLVAIVFLLTRIDYSRGLFTSSLVLALILFNLRAFTSREWERMVFHIVPFGSRKILEELSSGSFLNMARPEVPLGRHASVVVDFRAELPPEWERMLAQAALQGVPVYHVKQLTEALTGKVKIEHISENNLGSLVPNSGYSKIKQVIDYLLAALMLPLLAPILAIVGIAIKLDSRGPVLFKQRRVGARGQIFQLYKFRSMRASTCEQRDGNESRAEAITKSSDERITRVGAVLRRYRIDELPQVLNILRGEMSLIGPRPEALSLAEWYEAELPFYSYRHIVKPGITGWAQVNQGHVSDLSSVNTKLHYDFYYIKYFSLWMDILILLKTIRIVLVGFGSK